MEYIIATSQTEIMFTKTDVLKWKMIAQDYYVVGHFLSMLYDLIGITYIQS